MSEQINIIPESDQLTIIHKKAQDERLPIKFLIDGRIDSVSKYIGQRFDKLYANFAHGTQIVDAFKSIAQVNIEGGTIELQLDPSNEFGHIVKGSLFPNKDLDEYKINVAYFFELKSLLKLVRFNAPKIQDSQRLVDALQKFNIQSANSLRQEKTQKGSTNQSFNREVTTDIPDSFILSIPVFQGMDIERFRVEIHMDVTDASVRFWLESPELKQLIETRKAEILDKEIKLIEDKVLIIYKN